DEHRPGVAPALLLVGTALTSAGAGFGATVALSRRREAAEASASGSAGASLRHGADGTRLALRALGWGSAAAFVGVSVVTAASLALAGVRSLADLRVPASPASPSGGRRDFKTVRELVDFLLSEDARAGRTGDR
ncbi:hypothetical protein BOX15_Mlig033698g3, partial [Macrostomum lignano]